LRLALRASRIAQLGGTQDGGRGSQVQVQSKFGDGQSFYSRTKVIRGQMSAPLNHRQRAPAPEAMAHFDTRQ